MKCEYVELLSDVCVCVCVAMFGSLKLSRVVSIA
jgi:hypothetical protein